MKGETRLTTHSGSGEVLVCCREVGRTYGSGRASTVAVYSASCEVRRGDRIVLTGPSGSGKSTLVHILAGLDEPTSGSVQWPALGTQENLRPEHVAVVFQGPSLLPFLDVIENVALPLQLAGEDEVRARARARECLDLLELEEIGSKLPQEISGGQAQRVSVARALVGKPDLLIADEPTGQLDHVTAAIVVDALIAGAESAGSALVVSTHDTLIEERFAHRWHIADGCLVTSACAEAGP